MRVAITNIIQENKNIRIVFDYFGTERSTIITQRVKEYLLLNNCKPLSLSKGSHIEVIRSIQSCKYDQNKMMEFFKITKVYKK